MALVMAHTRGMRATPPPGLQEAVLATVICLTAGLVALGLMVIGLFGR